MAGWQKRTDAPKRITGTTLQKLREQLFTENPLCVMCQAAGRVRLATERDHIIPLSKTKHDEATNEGVQGLCAECHEAKTAKDMGWRKKPRFGADGWPIEG